MNINEIQGRLGVPETGTYDEFTEAAVRNFQLKNGLTVTGIVNNATQELLDLNKDSGFVDTDSFKGKIHNYPLNKNEYFIGPTKKEFVFLHHTAGWNDPYKVVKDWENDTRGKIGTSYVIGGVNTTTLDPRFDGEIVKTFPEQGYAWHLGVGNTSLHRNSIGIELCNFGPLTKKGNQYLMWANKPILPDLVVKLKKLFRGFEYFQKYSEDQLKSLKWLIQDIGKRQGIDITLGLKEKLKKNVDPWVVFDYSPEILDGSRPGLYTHTNVSPKNKWGKYEKWDLFPQPELIEMILSL